MPPTLNPVVAEQLRAFAQRLTSMVWVRGLCAAAVSMLATFTAIAWVDRLMVLTELTRWLLSFGGYAAVALVFWFLAGRTLAKPPSARELAKRLEKAWPGLRNHLVAAVELAEKNTEGQHDSHTFRELVQAGAARRIGDLRMEVVLPRAMVAPWLRAATVAGVGVVILLAVPALEFPRQLARALVPMADIERVARTKIRIVEPAADTHWLAQGDHQPIVVELAGANTDRAELEVLAADGKGERVVMSPGSGGQFIAAVPVGTGAFVFRVRAGDAMTKPVTIATRARPAVAGYRKIVEAPAYAQWPTRQVEEDHGNVSALDGSTVDLRMRVNQPVRAGELVLIANGKTNLVPLTAPAPDLVHVRLPVRESATYQVRLVAAETGLTNKFSPSFEIRAEPDLAPRVTLDSPRSDLVVAPDEVIALRGSAADDIGLAAVAQQFQVNGGQWVEVPLTLINKTNSPLAHRWDLLLLGLATGDRLGTKLVAVDGRGARAESVLALLTVGAEQYDSARAKSLAARQQVREALEAAAKATAELRRAYPAEALAKIRAGDELQRQQTVAGAAVALAETARQLERADQQLAGALREADAGREAAELAMLGGALSTARRELLPRAQADRVALAREKRETPDLSQANEVAKSSQRLADFTAQMAAHFNDLVAADQANALTERLDQLVKEQQRVAQVADNAGLDAREWQRVARRETAATSETAKAEQQLADLRQRAPKSVADRLGRPQDNLKSARGNMENALKNQPGRELATPTRQLKNATEQAAADTRTAARELGLRADKARAELAKLNESSAENVARLRKDVEQLAASERKLADTTKNGDENAKLKLQAETDREQAEAAWRAAMKQLEDRAQAEEARKDSDPQFAAQLGQARDALDAMRAAAERGTQNAAIPERLAALAKSLRALEAGRQLGELESTAKALARQERFEASAMDATTSRPRDWSWLEKQIAAAQREARNAGLGEKTANALADVARSEPVREVTREMAERRDGQRVPRPQADQLDQLAGQLQRVQAEATQAQAEARESLAGATAKLSERLAALAREAAELESDLKRGNSPTPGASGTNWHGRQLALNARVRDAASALRRGGSAQDLATSAGREQARDAEAAVELLREPPTKAEAALRDALAQSLGDAARHDKELADRLKLLAEHHRQLEAGHADGKRTELRKQEAALGTRAAQDERFAQLERLQQLANLPPDELQRELTAEVQRNPAMREELARLSREAVDGAQQRLQEAAETERALARQMEAAANAGKNSSEQALARAAQQQGEVANQLRGAAEHLQRASRNAQAMGNQPAAQSLQQSAQQAQASTDMADRARRAAQDGQQSPMQAGQNAAQLGNQLEQQGAGLAQMQGQMNASSGGEPKPPQSGSGSQTAGQEDSRPPSPGQQSAGQQSAASQGGQSGSQGQSGTQSSSGQSNSGQSAGSSGSGNSGSQGGQSGSSSAGSPAGPGQQGAGQSGNQAGAAQAGRSGGGSNNSAMTGRNLQPDARWLARALDGLNAGSPSSMADAARAIEAARQAGQQAMRGNGAGQGAGQSGASAGASGSEGSGQSAMGRTGGASRAGGTGEFAALPALGELRDADWAKLPPKLAQELRDAQQNGVAGDYRSVVEAYFKALADKARK